MNRGGSLLREMRSLFRYWPSVLEGVSHDVRQRYVGSVFGSLWAGIFPLMQLLIYAGLYTVVFKVRPAGLSSTGYVVLIFSGLIPLMAFSEALNAATGALSTNRTLLQNTLFPAELIPVRAALAAQISGLVALTATLLAGLALGRTGWKAFVFVPVLWVGLLMFTVGLGWVLSLFALVAKDVQHGLGLLIMLLFVLSPYAYTPAMMPHLLRIIIYANPLAYFVFCFQDLICYNTWPSVPALSGVLLLVPVCFVGGFAMFRRMKFVFFDYV